MKVDVIWVDGRPYFRTKFHAIPKSEVPQVVPPEPKRDMEFLTRHRQMFLKDPEKTGENA